MQAAQREIVLDQLNKTIHALKENAGVKMGAKTKRTHELAYMAGVEAACRALDVPFPTYWTVCMLSGRPFNDD